MGFLGITSNLAGGGGDYPSTSCMGLNSGVAGTH
jgi:hypothetical protein